MPSNKIRIEVFNNGDRYVITFKGQITRDKAIRLLDLVELLGGRTTLDVKSDRSASEMSKIEKVRLIAERNFPVGWFSSKDIQSAYEKYFNDPIHLSTVSTYLSRLADRGFFIKIGNSNKRRYKNMTSISKYQLHER